MNRSDRIRTAIFMILLSVLILGASAFLGIRNQRLRREIAEDTSELERAEAQLADNQSLKTATDALKTEIQNKEAEALQKEADAQQELLNSKVSTEALKLLAPDAVVDPVRLQNTDGSLWEELWGAYFASYEITNQETDPVYSRIAGKSFPGEEASQVALSELKYVRLLHYDFNGNICVGELIVGADYAEEYLAVFRELFLNQYPIRSMQLIDNFWDEGDDAFSADQKSIAADNTVCFNYRTQKPQWSTENLSSHARGLAIDVNPLENPDVENGVSKESAEETQNYVDRSGAAEDIHMISEGDLCWTAFTNNGFVWSGTQEEGKTSYEYQHFSVQ